MMYLMLTLEDSALMTLGYEGRTASEVVDVLAEAGVNTLIDVRLTPLSRKPGLSKHRLQAALRIAGVDYLHLRSLGNPRDNREGFRLGQTESRARFRALLRTPQARADIDQLCTRVQVERIALLCFEREAHRCHRELVSEELCLRDAKIGVRHL